MKTLMLDPHGDDVALFGAFTAIRENATVHVVNPTVPVEEINAAYRALGLGLSIGKVLPSGFDRVIPPAWQQEGHHEHNTVAELAYATWPATPPLSGYLTYAPRGRRSREGAEVKPEADWIARKLAALACFRSQIAQDSTRPWFFELLDLREYVTA